MEESCLVRCDSLDAGSGCDTEIDPLSFYPEGEPSPSELAQCEAEVGTLLSIIAEVNKKMGSLKAPSEPGDRRASGPPSPLFPDLLSHRLSRGPPEKITASRVTLKSPADRGCGGVVWSKLQDALTAVEDSISCRRSWAGPITSTDDSKHKEHLRAAEDSWVKSAQILEDMEREFGIMCLSDLPKQEHQEQEKLESPLRSPLRGQQGELERAPGVINPLEVERKLFGHQRARRSGSCSPSYRSSGSTGALTPDWAPSSFPGSPLPLRRAARAVASMSVGGERSPLGSLHSGSPCPSPISPETETERLHRYIERLKARNERLTAALERRKVESEQIAATLKRLEADCSTLQTALRYGDECEEAYVELLSLCDAKRQQSIPTHADPAEAVGGGPSPHIGKMGTEELSTSFSTAGVTQSPTGAPDVMEREVALRQLIQRLQSERAALCLPGRAGPGEEGKTNPAGAGPPAGPRGGHVTKDHGKPPDGKKEKASLFYELVSVREEMSDLRALIRLKEKELRCLEWSLMAQKAQEAAGVFVPESLREELDPQRLCGENAASPGGDGDLALVQSRPILKELQAVLQREQALKKRLALVHDSLNTALADASGRRDNEEQIARLTQAHSKALSSYRHIRRKYREQVWRLEQKVAAVMEGQQGQGAAPKATAAAAGAGEAPDWRREETVL